jgi:hypothetical protein
MEFTAIWWLPYYVAREIVVVWLSFPALVKFDSAISNRKLRTHFTALIEGHKPQHRFRKRVLTEPLLEWFGNRSLKLDSLDLFSTAEISSLSASAVNVLASVTTITSSVANQAEENLMCNYMSCMQSLNNLSLTTGLCDTVLSQKLCNILGSQCSKLLKLSIFVSPAQFNAPYNGEYCRSVLQSLLMYNACLKELTLRGFWLRVEDAAHLPTSLTSIDIVLTSVNGDVVIEEALHAIVQRCTRLRQLSISDLLHFERLHFRRFVLTDALLQSMAQRLLQLQVLRVASTRVDWTTLDPLIKRCRRLTRLKLNSCSDLSEGDFAGLLQLPALLELELRCGPLVTGADVLLLAPTALRRLSLTDFPGLTDACVEEICAMSPQLSRLYLSECEQLTARCVVAYAVKHSKFLSLHCAKCRRLDAEDALQQLKALGVAYNGELVLWNGV